MKIKALNLKKGLFYDHISENIMQVSSFFKGIINPIGSTSTGLEGIGVVGVLIISLPVFLVMGLILFYYFINSSDQRFSEIDNSFEIASERSRQTVEESAFLNEFINDIFVQIRHAWEHNDLSKVQPLITKHFYNKFNHKLVDYKEKGLHDYMGDIHINELRLIEANSYSNEGEEERLVFMNGHMVNEVISINKTTARGQMRSFEDIWVFVKVKEQWLVHDIVEAYLLADDLGYDYDHDIAS